MEDAVEGFANFTNADTNNDDDFPLEKPKTGKKCGGFQGYGLSYSIIKGITTRGYKIPTPIQRKTIPLALQGRDIVAMARTGSGKTACFLIPLFEKLKTRQAKTGVRALILSPTRELALQTLKFIKDLAKFTGLKASAVLGGDSMDNQFSAIHENPDIIVATPGRFLHVCVEMDLNLKFIEYVVFDEADRLFEMGFAEQMTELLNRLPDSRQTLLFSATLPKLLVEFAKAGLEDPVLIRLDVESKLPEGLKLTFITCRLEEKVAVLLSLLKTVVKPDAQTVVFAATMHHVEYLHMILDKANISNTYVYSNLDPTARKINTAKFQTGKIRVLIVTDVAARGIDIPHLDNVINFNFPGKSKLFVHRVGRCARAGRSGQAYNIVSPDEYAHLLDLHLFLGLPFSIVPPTKSGTIPETAIGKMPQSLIEEEQFELINWHDTSVDISNMQRVSNNAYQQYLQSRPAATVDSNKRVKILNIPNAGVLPQFSDSNNAAVDFLCKMKNYRPRGTVFEICAKPSSSDHKIMKEKRAFHKENILMHHRKTEKDQIIKEDNSKESTLPCSTENEINNAFGEVISSKKRKSCALDQSSNKKKKILSRDDEYYIPHFAPDRHTEDSLAVNNFATDVEKAQIDLLADNEDSRRLQSQIKKWDRKKKKMITVNNNPKAGKIRTESGAWIPMNYKTNRYQQWKEKSKVDATINFDDDDDAAPLQKLHTTANTHWARHNQKLKNKMQAKSELKTPEQVLKRRKIDEKKQQRSGKKKGGRGKKGSKKR